jgi:hypothetical protein
VFLLIILFILILYNMKNKHKNKSYVHNSFNDTNDTNAFIMDDVLYP